MDDVERLQRETEYHNARFSHETREAQHKYYFALKSLEDDYERSVLSHSAGVKVLDYGCGRGDWSLKAAAVAEEVHGLDISEVAIEGARKRAPANAHFHVGDAHATPFDDGTFDFVFGSGIIHHLDTRLSLTEISRVLKPNGTAVFLEPLGHNPVFNMYRDSTPDARTIDEHPLLKSDYNIAGELFSENDWTFYGLSTLGSVPFRNSSIGKPVRKVLTMVDRAVLSLPGVRWQGWMALITLRK